MAKIIKLDLKKAAKKVKEFIIDVWGFVKSALRYYRSIKRVGKFEGYCAYWFAQQFKAMRENGWQAKWDQMGRQQGIFPLDETRLIVCSKMELKVFKKKGLISKSINPRKLMKKSY